MSQIRRGLKKALLSFNNLRISPELLWLLERFKIATMIAGMLVARRELLTKSLNRSKSPMGRALKQLSALSGSLERARHSTALPFAH